LQLNHLAPHALNVFIPLVETTQERGPTEFVPGETKVERGDAGLLTHSIHISHTHILYTYALSVRSLLPHKGSHRQWMVPNQPCVVLLAAGDALIFDYRRESRFFVFTATTITTTTTVTITTVTITTKQSQTSWLGQREQRRATDDLPHIRARQLVRHGQFLRETLHQSVSAIVGDRNARRPCETTSLNEAQRRVNTHSTFDVAFFFFPESEFFICFF
jgi:hypothetical protein